jgi:hypothetical protein
MMKVSLFGCIDCLSALTWEGRLQRSGKLGVALASTKLGSCFGVMSTVMISR